MKIRNVVHPDLHSLVEEDKPAGLREADASRLRRILSFLQDMAGESELHCIAGWAVQPAPSTGRWRMQVRAAPIGTLTFGIDAQDGEITDLDYEGHR